MMRRYNLNNLKFGKDAKPANVKSPLQINSDLLDKITSKDCYTKDLMKPAGQFLTRRNGVNEERQLFVICGLQQLQEILTTFGSQNLFQEPFFFLLQLENDFSERRWVTFAVTKLREDEEAIKVIFKDPTGQESFPVDRILSQVFSENVNFVINLEGTDCKSNESGILSLKWMEVMMVGLQSEEKKNFIYNFPFQLLELSEGELKTDLKVDLVSLKIRKMLSEVEVNERTKMEVRKCIRLSRKVREKLGKPVAAYEKLLKEEMEKMEENQNYEMDEEAIGKAQKEMTEQLKGEDTTGMDELMKHVIPEFQVFSNCSLPFAEESEDSLESKATKNYEEKKKQSPYEVFKDSFRLLRGAEETEKLKTLLSLIADKFGIQNCSLFEYFQSQRTVEPPEEESENPKEFSLDELISTLPQISEVPSNSPNMKSLVRLLAELVEEKELDSSDEENNFRQKYIRNEETLEMEKDFKEVKSQFENKWSDASVHEVHSWAKEIRGHLESYVEGIAVMNRVFQLTTGGNVLRDAQILSLIWFLRDSKKTAGRLAQISTGEGKTAIIAALASLKVLQSGVVDVLTSNEVLAQEAVDEMKGFFHLLGISVDTNNSEKKMSKRLVDSNPKPRNCYKADVVYGTITNFQFDYLKHSSEKTRGCRQFVFVILDEVDNLSVDNGGNIAKLATPFPGMECLKYVYIKIWQELVKAEVTATKDVAIKLEKKQTELYGNNENLGEGDKKKLNKEFETFRYKLIANLIEEIKKHIKVSDPCGIELVHNHLRPYCQSMLERWIDNAFFAKFECRENEMYVLKEVNGEAAVVPVDFMNTGVTLQNTQWSHGLHQFVQLKHNLRITCESLTSSFISNVGFIQLYENKNIFGLTGTLGSITEKEMLQEAYKVEFKVIPRYKKFKIKMYESLVVRDSQWMNLVSISAFIEASHRNRSVLIICKTIKELKMIKNNVEACLKMEKCDDVKVKTYVDEEGSFVVKEEVGQREIIVATNIAGRGTNFKTSEELEAVGGLHVVVAFLPYNQRVQDQAFGRTARQGNNGTAQLILKESDILEISLEAKETLTVQKIFEKRDQLEKERLTNIKTQKLKEIIFNDELFTKFSGMYAKFIAKYSENPETSIVGEDLKELWAFWLHKQNFTYEKIKTTNVATEFDKFRSEAKEIIESCKITWNPFNEIRRGELFLQNGKKEEAEKAVRRGINMSGNDNFCSSGYLKLFEIEVEKGGQLMERFKKALGSLIFISVEKDEAYKTKAKDALEKVVTALEKELNYINKNFIDEKSNGDFQAILIPNQKNLMLRHLNGRFTALSTFQQHAKSLLKKLEESEKSDVTAGLALGSRIPHYLKKLDENKPDEKTMKEALTSEELDELQLIGLETIYSLRDVHDAHEETVIGAQIQIGSGLACLATGLLFPPSLPFVGPIAGAFISEGICDIVIELLSRGHVGFDMKSYVKGKCISVGIALATMGISAITSSVKLMDKASKACKSLAKLLRKCPYLTQVCEMLATKLDTLAIYFDKLKLLAEFQKLKDLEKLDMLHRWKATGELEKLGHLGGLEKLRQLEHLKSFGKLDVIPRVQILKSTAASIGKQTVSGVLMSQISEHLVTAGLSRLLEGLKPEIEKKVREGISEVKLETLENRKEVENLVSEVFDGSYGEIGTAVLQEIALGVVRHSSHWKLKVASITLDTALSLHKIYSYTSSFCQKFNEAVVAKGSKQKFDSDDEGKREVVVSLVTNKIYGLIVQLAGKGANIAINAVVSKVMGGSKKKKVSEEDERTLAKISEAFETLGLSPGATEEEVDAAYAKANTCPEKFKHEEAYKLIKDMHREWEAGRSKPVQVRWPPGRVTGDISAINVETSVKNSLIGVPGDGGNISTISSKLKKCIQVHNVGTNEVIEFGSEFKENGKPHAVVGYLPPTEEGDVEGHFFQLIDNNVEESLNSIQIPTTPNKNCLYESLAPQINGGTLSPQELRELGESFSLENFVSSISKAAANLLNNPITKVLYVKAREYLLLGGSIESARYFRDEFIVSLNEMNLESPEEREISLADACGNNPEALKTIETHSPGCMGTNNDPGKLIVTLYKIKNVDSLVSFILNFKHDPNNSRPFALEFANGIRSVVGGDLYSLVACKGEEVFVADSQYHGKGLGKVFDALMGLTDPQHQLGLSQYPEVSGRLICESIRNKATLVTTCLAMTCNPEGTLLAGSFVESGLPVTASKGIIWEKSDVERISNPAYLLDLHQKEAMYNKKVISMFNHSVRSVSGNKEASVKNILANMSPDQRHETQSFFHKNFVENLRFVMNQGGSPINEE